MFFFHLKIDIFFPKMIIIILFCIFLFFPDQIERFRNNQLMSRFQVSQIDGVGGGGGGGGGEDAPNSNNGNGGIDNPAMDPVELNVYGLYS